jgi:hypothetical protein
MKRVNGSNALPSGGNWEDALCVHDMVLTEHCRGCDVDNGKPPAGAEIEPGPTLAELMSATGLTREDILRIAYSGQTPVSRETDPSFRRPWGVPVRQGT